MTQDTCPDTGHNQWQTASESAAVEDGPDQITALQVVHHQRHETTATPTRLARKPFWQRMIAIGVSTPTGVTNCDQRRPNTGSHTANDAAGELKISEDAMVTRKQVYKITYPNGKIYVGMDLTGSLPPPKTSPHSLHQP
jgi:hypothetical protein